MTIAISLKVNDGVVLAADSASTVTTQGVDGTKAVTNIYNHTNKIFNLCKGLPVGAVTWGMGAIGVASIETIVKDFRKELTESRGEADSRNCDVENIAKELCKHVFEEHWKPVIEHQRLEGQQLGFIVAGYSSGDSLASEYKIDFVDSECPIPRKLRESTAAGLTWGGQGEAIQRLLLGYGLELPIFLAKNLGVPQDDIPALEDVLTKQLVIPLFQPPMPIQDAIDLVAFFVDTTIKFSQYAPSAPTVGGPIEVATITKHEGFKWVSRKHYYSQQLNPERQQLDPEMNGNGN